MQTCCFDNLILNRIASLPFLHMAMLYMQVFVTSWTCPHTGSAGSTRKTFGKRTGHDDTPCPPIAVALSVCMRRPPAQEFAHDCRFQAALHYSALECLADSWQTLTVHATRIVSALCHMPEAATRVELG